MCSAIGAIGEGVLTNRIRLCILDMSETLSGNHCINACFIRRYQF